MRNGPLKKHTEKKGAEKSNESFFMNAKKDIEEIPQHTKSIRWGFIPGIQRLEKVLERCPELERVTYPFSTKEKFNEPIRVWHEENDVCIDFSDDKKAFRHAYRQEVRRRFFSMTDEERGRLQNLLDMQVAETNLFCRYYCLNGEEQTSHAKLAKHFGVNPMGVCSQLIQAILHYLFPDIRVQKDAERRAQHLVRHTRTVQQHKEKMKEKKKLMDALGISHIPEALSSGVLPRYLALQKYIKAYPDAFSFFCDMWPLHAEVISLRYGIGGKMGVKSLREISTMLCISHERVRQYEEDVFRRLRICSLLLSKKDRAMLVYRDDMPKIFIEGKSFQERKRK